MSLGITVTEPTSKGLATAIARAMRDGSLQPGQRLPSIRAVAVELGVSPTTVASAWQTLLRSGLISTAGRGGTVIATRTPDATRYRRAVDPTSRMRLDLSAGVPDPLLLPDLSVAVSALTEALAPGSYLDDPVLPALDELLRASWPFDPTEVTVVDGAMDGLDLAARVLFGFGDRVLVETPCFPPLLDLLDAHRVEVVPIGLDDEGIRIDAVRTALETPARALVLQPRAQNPTGVSMSARRAEALSALLTSTGTIVVEDESWSSVAQADAVSVGTWLPEQTVHIRSFSKSHGPDLRLAAMSGPEEFMAEVVRLRQFGQGWTSRILQRILIELLTDANAIARIDDARSIYAQRRAAMVAALAEEGISVAGTDGYNLWVPVADETTAVLSLASDGIGVAPGAPFQYGADTTPHVRVTVSALAEGYVQIASIIARAAKGSGRPLI
jgi:DNA-binding transcriptional MocR family regulator